VFYRLATLMLAQALDLTTFVLMVRTHGVAAEANPLVAGLFVTLGVPAVLIAKGLLVVVVGSLGIAAAAVSSGGLVWRVAGGLPIALAIAIGLVGGITNAAVILA
jgi:hypothetical protein